MSADHSTYLTTFQCAVRATECATVAITICESYSAAVSSAISYPIKSAEFISIEATKSAAV